MRVSTQIVAGSVLAAAATAAVALVSHLQLKAAARDARGIEEEWREMDRVASVLVALSRPASDPDRGAALAREAERLLDIGETEHSAADPGDAHEARERGMGETLAAICLRAAGAAGEAELSPLRAEAQRVALAFWQEDRSRVPARAEMIGREQRRMHAVNLASSAGLLLLPLLFLAWVRVRVARPLLQIQRRVATIGELAPAAQEGGTEMERLRASIEAMAEAVGSRRKSLELAVEERTAQLRHADRLGGLGKIAAAVAHEINNPLGNIALCIEGIRADPAAAPAYLATMQGEIDRCTETTRKLLSYARYRPETHEPIDTAALLPAVGGMARGYAARARVRIRLDPPAAARVRGDEGQLRQVLLNVVLNAVDASPDGGEVRVRSRLEERSFVVEVEDDGEGVPAGMEEKIFEPFVTTKRAGEGTGLGLAIAREIAEAHGGTLRLLRRGGEKGAIFEFRLPCCEEKRA